MIHVSKFIPGGMALGTLENGKKIFFWNALPGEVISDYIILKEKKSYIEAVATTIESTSKFRQNPKDACFLSTSPWQILDFSYELEAKRDLVKESLLEFHIPLDQLTIEPVKTDGKDYFYRNKMEYSLYWENKTERIYLSFHARNSHKKIPLFLDTPEMPKISRLSPFSLETAGSSLECPKIAKKALKIVEELNNAHASARDFQSILLRCNQNGNVSGGLFEKRKPHPVFANLTDKILGKEYSYSPNGFFQINLPVYELALKEIKREIDASPIGNVLDLYAGVGTIGLSVAPDRNLTLVEVDKSAYHELVNNCKSKTANPILSKSEDALNFIKPDQIVIVDPPRAGCDEKLINRFLEILPEKIIYLSCNPSTQARDIASLTKTGNYRITSIKPFNFFPHTPHIENLITLEKTK